MPDPRTPSDPAGRASWRSKAKAAAAGPRAVKAGGWAKKADDGHERTVMRYRTKVFLWASLFFALVVGFVVWLIWTPILTPVFVATAVNYEFPLPPNAFAEEDAARLADLHGKEVLKYVKLDLDTNAFWLKQLSQQVSAAKPGGPRKNVIVIYLSMHGAVNGKNEPCMIPPSVSPRDESKWLRVADLLDSLFPIDNAKLRSPKINKLLILDSNRMDLNWSLGLLYNSFAERLLDVVHEKNIPGLAVLNSASPGQIGWAATELRGSVFGYFLSKGLNGSARTGKNGKIITLQDLTNYLANNVSLWVSEKRADNQTPMLIPAEADFPLVYARSQEKDNLPPAENSRDPRWEEVQKLWLRHAALKEKQVGRLYPQEWEKFQQGLLRLEQLVQAGSAYQSQFAGQLTESKNDLSTLEKSDNSRALAAFSLPLKNFFGQGPSEAEGKALSPPWKAPPEPVKVESKEKEPEKQPLANPETKDKESEKPPASKDTDKKDVEKPEDKTAKADGKQSPEKKPAPATPPPVPVRYTYLAASSAALNWLSDISPSRTDLQKALQYADGGVNRPQAAEVDLVEIQFLRMLDKFLDPNVWNTSPQAVKTAILARKMAEIAATPKQARAFYWIFAQVEAGDKLRRAAEDRLFIGDTASLREADEKWNEAAGNSTGKYQQAVATTEIVVNAYRWRDQAYGDIPYLARWILSRTHRRPADDLKLFEAIKAARRLAFLLDDWKAENAASEIPAATAALKRNLEDLQSAYFRDCTNNSGDDKEKLARLLNVLSVPLVTGRERNDYWNNCLKIVTNSSEFKNASLDENKNVNPSKNADPYLERLQLDGMKTWVAQTHPVLLAMESTTGDEEPNHESTNSAEAKGSVGEQLALQSARVRTLLNTEHKTAEEQLAETIRLAQISKPALAKLEEIRAPLSRTDRMVRAFAPLQGESLSWDDPRHDPLNRLQNLDRHNLLLWQAWRTLEDFWGPNGAADKPYFEIAARAYLKSATDLFKEDAALREGAVYQRLLSGAKAAQIGLQMEKPRSPSLDSEAPSVQQSLAVSAPDSFPPGEAAVYLQGGDDSLFPVAGKPNLKQPDLRRMANKMPGSAKPAGLSFWILNDSRLSESPQLHAVAYYRGFLLTRDFYVNSAAGRDLLWANKMYPKPTITVRGDLLKKSNLMFIFDCSGSMSKVVKSGTNHEGPSQDKTRFEIVRDAMEKILDRLAKPPYPYNVGLIIYAHRVGWIDDPRGSKTNFHIVIRDPKNPAAFILPPPGFNTRPSFDVELALPLGRFTQYECAAVKDRLDALRPLGETPLYLSLLQALKNLEAADPDSVRHIIVLTDGGNEQSDHTNPQITSDPQLAKLLINLPEVEDAFKEPAHKGVKLDVLGFDLDEVNFESAEEKSSARELMNFANREHGYYPVNNSDSLTKALEKTMGLVKYEVQRVRDGKIITPDPLDLNTTCESVDRPGDYRIELVDHGQSAAADAAKAQVTLEGGEAEDLSVQEDPIHGRRRLVHHRYKDDLRDMANNIPAPGDAKKQAFFLGAHLPDPIGGGVKFFVSVQNADAELFSPRPVEVWAEIKPVMPEGADLPAYVCFDRTFVSNRPVPELEFSVPNWPSETKDAEIRLWCKFEKTPPDRQVSVSESRGKPLQLDGLPDVSFEVETRRGTNASDPFQIIVTETHPPGGDLGLVKVEVDHPPKSIKRHYNDKTGMVVHTFFFDDSAASDADQYQILFTSTQKLKDGAVATPNDRPLKVKVPLSPNTGQ